VGQAGIYVNLGVAPAEIETEMTRGYAYGVEALPIPRLGQPDDIARRRSASWPRRPRTT
jgi:hypothetical protein